ncbi:MULTISPECIES: MFS transporter [Glutamicibacter]|uniref:MFS superfamily transporter n=1 Tax=Glutamicibacter arilaitensis (strain DSM 16368 / CIP 108037 / IAM 15318 / JCM 13566 / NCIMB 14258 / Re117) TaxID=861360 RepID=A0ABM9PVB9_GLUAR|nr:MULTISPECIES: MFS transporter [Glutamicibacter]CBT75106.1 putative MFS superfamily transporter [Glutamicibacter arilaitensis Re117]HCH47249.1 MFS transporter [Glutamicibacter sp.]
MPLGLIALAIMGLLPDVAADFAVSEAAAGWLISGYALSVVVGALGLTAATVRLPRKPVLVGLLVLFILGNSLTAMASTYEVAMIGRVIAALCHGAFFGIGAVVAADLVPANKKAGAIAIMFTGLTAANVLGVPFGTLLGQHSGWRSTFWAISGIGVIALIGILVLVPAIKHAAEGISLRKELGAFTSLQVWLSLAITVLGYGGMFGAFTYIAYTLTEVTGFNETSVPWLLMLFGIGLFAGNWIGGRMADKSIDRTLLFFIAALLAVLIAFAALASNPVATMVALFLMGGFGFGTVPGLQSRIMQFAGSAPTLASGANIGAFNLGNALGAWAGGLGIAAGLGYTSPIWIGAAITVAALLVVLVAMSLAKKSAKTPELVPAC